MYLKTYTSISQVLTRFTFKHIIKSIKHDMLIFQYKAYTNRIWRIEIVTNTDRTNFYFFRIRWSSHLNSLIVIHSLICPPSSDCIHHQGTKNLSHFERAHTYIKNNRCGLWYPYSFGSLRVSKIFVFEIFILSK